MGGYGQALSDFEEQADRCRRLAAGSTDLAVIETLTLMAAKYAEHSLRLKQP